MRTFKGYIDSRVRTNKEHLHVLSQILEKAGFQVTNKLDDTKEPYLYVHKPVSIDPILEQLSFGGVRFYTRGKDIVCYRSQNKVETEPFGTSRQLDLEGMFKDLVRESDKKMIGNRIIFYVIKELKEFFINSAQAEREEDTGGEDSQMGAAITGSTGTDYSQQMQDNDVNRRG